VNGGLVRDDAPQDFLAHRLHLRRREFQVC
jgi:hypothetical protein